MFDIGFSELLIVAIVALIVLGPERLPKAVKTAGMWLGRIKRTMGNVQKAISEELRIEEMRSNAKAQQEKLEREADKMVRPFNETLRDEILTPRSSEAAATDKGAPEPAVAETVAQAKNDAQ